MESPRLHQCPNRVHCDQGFQRNARNRARICLEIQGSVLHQVHQALGRGVALSQLACRQHIAARIQLGATIRRRAQEFHLPRPHGVVLAQRRIVCHVPSLLVHPQRWSVDINNTCDIGVAHSSQVSVANRLVTHGGAPVPPQCGSDDGEEQVAVLRVPEVYHHTIALVREQRRIITVYGTDRFRRAVQVSDSMNPRILVHGTHTLEHVFHSRPRQRCPCIPLHGPRPRPRIAVVVEREWHCCGTCGDLHELRSLRHFLLQRQRRRIESVGIVQSLVDGIHSTARQHRRGGRRRRRRRHHWHRRGQFHPGVGVRRHVVPCRRLLRPP